MSHTAIVSLEWQIVCDHIFVYLYILSFLSILLRLYTFLSRYLHIYKKKGEFESCIIKSRCCYKCLNLDQCRLIYSVLYAFCDLLLTTVLLVLQSTVIRYFIPSTCIAQYWLLQASQSRKKCTIIVVLLIWIYHSLHVRVWKIKLPVFVAKIDLYISYSLHSFFTNDCRIIFPTVIMYVWRWRSTYF